MVVRGGIDSYSLPGVRLCYDTLQMEFSYLDYRDGSRMCRVVDTYVYSGVILRCIKDRDHLKSLKNTKNMYNFVISN